MIRYETRCATWGGSGGSMLPGRPRSTTRLPQSLDKDDPAWRAAMDEIRQIMDMARAKVARPATTSAPPAMGDRGREYDPDARHVIGETPNLAFVARAEERADELVRAAAAL
ncbi:hypothetical protein [Streptomyces sp. NPDC008001]|uniref:hypothetical protein n=1 Tax=Streptomyces sp. NPDC008001 TaxID=3364804 RepID=UPI0036E5AD68